MCFHEVDACQELVRRVDTDELLALDPWEPWQSSPRADECSVEALLIHELLECRSRADEHVGLECDAPFLKACYLRSHDLLWKPEFGDAVHEDTTELVQCLEHRHRMALLGEVTRAGEPCRARTDYGNSATR